MVETLGCEDRARGCLLGGAIGDALGAPGTDLCQAIPQFDDDPLAWQAHEQRYPYDS